MKITDWGLDDRCKAENEENYLQQWKIQQEETKEKLRLDKTVFDFRKYRCTDANHFFFNLDI